MFRKMWIVLLIVGVMLAILVPAVAEAGGPRGRGNGDGVCDNCLSGGSNFVDADGDGVCDNCLSGGSNFVDADGDGVCDNCGQRIGRRYGRWGR